VDGRWAAHRLRLGRADDIRRPGRRGTHALLSHCFALIRSQPWLPDLMKTHRNPLWIPLAGVLTLGGPASAAVFPELTTDGRSVPDADSSGLVSSANLSATGYRITDVNVTLNLKGAPASFGGWNGDLYAWLGHGGVLSVLLNRPGRAEGRLLGYADDGLEVTLDDDAPGDIHLYQTTWSGAPARSPVRGNRTRGSWTLPSCWTPTNSNARPFSTPLTA